MLRDVFEAILADFVTYATFLMLCYLDENGKKVWSGFTTYVGTFFVLRLQL